MKTNETHTSLETGKLLKDCEINSKYSFIDNEGKYIFANNGFILLETRLINNEKEFYPAFTWQEILWEYPEKFFGENFVNPPNWWGEGVQNMQYKFATIYIFNLLQDKKYNEADLYFRENCILINK